MSTESNKTAVREMFSAIDAAQSMSPLDSFAAANYAAHFTGAGHLDREGMKGFGNGFFQACPGLAHHVEQVVGEGEFVTARLTIRGRQTQPLMTPAGPLPASGKSFEMPVINMMRFADGKVVEHWSVFDMMGFLQQLGAIPT